MVIGSIASTDSSPATVSPTKISGIPAIVMISPAIASVAFTFSSPSFARISVTFPFLCTQSFEVMITS